MLRAHDSGLATALWEVDNDQILKIVHGIAADPNVEHVAVFDEQGRLRAQSGDSRRAGTSSFRGSRRMTQQDMDAEAVELLGELLPPARGTALGEGLSRVAQAMEGCDFDAAPDPFARMRGEPA